MNPVFNHSHTFPASPRALWDALNERGDWWGPDMPAPRKVDPPSKITLDVPDGTFVILLLQEVPDGTELSIVHSRFASGEQRDDEGDRWNERLSRLAALL